MLGLPSVQSTAGESSTTQAGSGSPGGARAVERDEGEVAAGRIAGQHDVLRVDSLGEQSAVGGVAIVRRGGERELGHQPVVRDERPRAQLAAQAGGERRVRIGKPERERPAVQVQHDALDARLRHDDPFARHAAAFDGHPLDIRLDPELPGVQLLVRRRSATMSDSWVSGLPIVRRNNALSA